MLETPVSTISTLAGRFCPAAGAFAGAAEVFDEAGLLKELKTSRVISSIKFLLSIRKFSNFKNFTDLIR
jgi:hypothetical protein